MYKTAMLILFVRTFPYLRYRSLLAVRSKNLIHISSLYTQSNALFLLCNSCKVSYAQVRLSARIPEEQSCRYYIIFFVSDNSLLWRSYKPCSSRAMTSAAESRSRKLYLQGAPKVCTDYIIQNVCLSQSQQPKDKYGISQFSRHTLIVISRI